MKKKTRDGSKGKGRLSRWDDWRGLKTDKKVKMKMQGKYVCSGEEKNNEIWRKINVCGEEEKKKMRDEGKYMFAEKRNRRKLKKAGKFWSWKMWKKSRIWSKGKGRWNKWKDWRGLKIDKEDNEW